MVKLFNVIFRRKNFNSTAMAAALWGYVLSGGTLQGSLRPSTTMLQESTEAYHDTLTLYLTKSTYYTSRVGLCNMTKNLYPNKGHHKTAHFLSFCTQTMSMRQKYPLFQVSVQCRSSVMSCSLNSIFICVAFMQTSSCRRMQSIIKMMKKYCTVILYRHIAQTGSQELKKN